MASSLAAPVTALQVGTFFVTQYYHVLQNQPEYAHQFYTDLSTMSRTDRDKQETATGMMEIHNRVMSQNYTSGPLEVKSVDAQESLNGGLLVMVTGCVQRNNMEGKRNFVQTFFLAPQEKGFYVLNDIFRFFEDDLYVQKQTDVMTNGDHEPQLKSAVTEPAYVSSFRLVLLVHLQDFGVCYAFIEFEDTSSVQSAVGASPLPFGGRHIYVEEKRTTSSGSRGRRGRGRGFQNEGSRGRGYYGARPYGRGSGQDFGREYLNRGRSSGSRGGYGTGGANGFQQTDSRRGNSLRQPRRAGGNQMSHNSANAEKTFE